MVHRATIYTRQGCCLCQQARRMLEQWGIEPQMVDIDADPQLQQRYSDCVPVVVLDGVERFRGTVNPVLLRRLLTSRANRSDWGGYEAPE